MSSKLAANAILALTLLLVACGGATSNDVIETPVDPNNPQDGDTMPDPPAVEEESPVTNLLAPGRGWLGIVLEQVELDEAATLGFEHGLVRVEQVFPDSPASSAELQEGDLILQLDGTPLAETGALVRRIGATPPGTTVTLTVGRRGEVLEQQVMLGLRPELEELVGSLLAGHPAPPLVANRLDDDTPLSLDDERGRIVVIDFWATWCGPCRRVLPDLDDLQRRYAEHGVTVIGLSNEDRESIDAYISEHPLDYTIAYDIDESTTRSYYVTAYPTLMLIDREGVIRHVFIGGTEIPNLEAYLLVIIEESTN